MWEIIKLTVNQNMDAMVCVVGDFNSIRRPEEMVGRREMVECRDIDRFEEIISQSNLSELSLVGRSYTWYHPEGSCKSKIDHMFVNNKWIRKWPNQILKPIFLESCAIVSSKLWLEHPQFKKFFQEKWQSYQVEGWAAFRLKEKLKLFKSDLRVWNK
ncbi:hypothetical protein ACS0TY_013168 [Phlomoides rotata]